MKILADTSCPHQKIHLFYFVHLMQMASITNLTRNNFLLLFLKSSSRPCNFSHFLQFIKLLEIKKIHTDAFYSPFRQGPYSYGDFKMSHSFGVITTPTPRRVWTRNQQQNRDIVSYICQSVFLRRGELDCD